MISTLRGDLGSVKIGVVGSTPISRLLFRRKEIANIIAGGNACVTSGALIAVPAICLSPLIPSCCSSCGRRLSGVRCFKTVYIIIIARKSLDGVC